MIDQSAEKIVETAKRSAEVSGPIPLPTEKSVYTIIRAVHMTKIHVNNSNNVLINV